MLVAGPTIRLPLQSWANYAAYLGQAICFAAGVWFVLVVPAGWSVQTGSQPVIMLHAVGLAVITVGGALVPLSIGVTREDLEASEGRAARLEAEVADLEAELDAERDRLSSELDTAREETAVAEADRAALQATVDVMRTSQSRFDLYGDRTGQWRWRLRHRNGNVVADSGEGYTRKHNAQKGMASVRRNALGATTLVFEAEEELPAGGTPSTPSRNGRAGRRSNSNRTGPASSAGGSATTTATSSPTAARGTAGATTPTGPSSGSASVPTNWTPRCTRKRPTSPAGDSSAATGRSSAAAAKATTPGAESGTASRASSGTRRSRKPKSRKSARRSTPLR